MNCKNKFLPLLKSALKEDIGSQDITSYLFIIKREKVRADLLLKERAVIAGLDIVREIFRIADKGIRFKPLCKDGMFLKAGAKIAAIEGQAPGILKAERTAINFLAHLSGIATVTYDFVRSVRPYPVKIMDTRKTTPGLRVLEKYAVKMGGGFNHRLGLWDQILIKDNHLVIHPLDCSWQRIKSLKARLPRPMKIEVEVKNLNEFIYAMKAKPDIILLDNMREDKIKQAVKIRSGLRKKTGNILLEVSGGVTLNNVRRIASLGVDMISIGSLTHSAKAVDISLEVIG